jgi:hypothetical protein
MAAAWHTGGYDRCDVGALTEASVDNNSSNNSYSFHSEDPDDYDWDPTTTPYYSSGTLSWDYSSSIDYTVPSGLAWFSVKAFVIAVCDSYVSIDAEEQTFNEETFSVNESCVEIESTIEVDIID